MKNWSKTSVWESYSSIETRAEKSTNSGLPRQGRACFSGEWSPGDEFGATGTTTAASREYRTSHGTGYPKKGHWHLRQSKWVIFQFMKEHAHQFPITKMSQVFKVSRSGYYRWLNGEPSRRSRYNQGLGAAIRKEWKDSKEKYGSPRIHRGLLAQGWKVSRPRVARLMRAMGIASRIRRKWVKTTDSSHTLAVAPNLLDRQFFPSQLGQVWVSDITYLPGNMLMSRACIAGARETISGSASSRVLPCVIITLIRHYPG